MIGRFDRSRATIRHPKAKAPAVNKPELFSFDDSYARLPGRFYAELAPTPVAKPSLIRLNEALADDLGLDPAALKTPEAIAVLAGNSVPANAHPLAMAYAGHQFGNWVPQLGDGRAILLGEVTGRDGLLYDIQLKGSGPTPYSRMGDGRAWLGPVLREYIVGEAMAALGIPSTRSLAAVATGEPVVRENGPMPGAILTRVARAHIRVGTFQFFAAREDTEALKVLADYAIDRLYPKVREAENPYLAFLEAVVARQAALIARWMQVGFIHGVMNTDNMSIAGETIDYGPCAFMDVFHPDTVFSSIDRMGRYAYRNQPGIGQWNLAAFAQSLIPLLDPDQEKAVDMAQAAIDAYPEQFHTFNNDGLARKIGLASFREGDDELITNLLKALVEGLADYTLTFRGLAAIADPVGDASNDKAVRALFEKPKLFDEWAVAWRARLKLEDASVPARQEQMRQVNPAIIPRNHLVEAAIDAAVSRQDFTPFEALTTALAKPFEDLPVGDPLTLPPKDNERVYQTFCGT
ncbi:YdiU family protein [Rhodobacteraceae bacterium NNCM2]|nr:YdiU family protein [Coraliihabitans acroporae]